MPAQVQHQQAQTTIPLNPPQLLSKTNTTSGGVNIVNATKGGKRKKSLKGGTTSVTAPVVPSSGSSTSAPNQNSQSTANANTATYYTAQNQASTDGSPNNNSGAYSSAWQTPPQTKPIAASGGSRKTRKSRKSRKSRKNRKSRKHKRKTTYKK
jgi:hypothetical protein